MQKNTYNKVKNRLFYSKTFILVFGLLYLLGDVFSNVTSFSEIPFERLYLLSSFLIILIVLSILPNYRFKRKKLEKVNCKISITFPLIILFVIYIITTNEILENFIAFFNREQRGTLYSSMIFVISDIFIKSVIIYFLFYFDILTKKQKKIILILFFFIIFYDLLMLGGRRTSVFLMIAFIGSVFLDYSKRKKKIVLTGLLLVGFVFFIFGAVREIIVLNNEIKDYDLVEFAANGNEFELVTRSIDKYVNYAHNNGFIYGESIISWPLLFVPRSFWKNKPMQIGETTGIFTNFFGEVYLNFGFLSPFFIFLVFFTMLTFINTNKINSLIYFCLIPEMFRTPIGLYMFTLLFIFLFVKILDMISLPIKTKIHE